MLTKRALPPASRGVKIGTVHQTSWDWRAAANFILGGAGSAFLSWAALAAVAGGSTTAPWVILAGLALMGAGLACVWLEIGRPWRALNVFLHPGTSWMTRESIVAVACMALAVAWLVQGGTALVATLVLTSFAFLYCQARIFTEAKGIPAWRAPQAGWLVATTGLIEGAGLLLLSAELSGEAGFPAGSQIASLCLLLVPARAIAWSTYRGALGRTESARRASSVLERAHWPMLSAAHALPAALFAAGIAGALIAIASGWSIKFMLVTRAAHVQGYAFGALRTGHPLGLRPSQPAAKEKR